MTPRCYRVLWLWLPFVFVMVQPLGPSVAATPIWANAKWVKATSIICEGRRFLVLKGNSVKIPTQSISPICNSIEEIYHQVNVSKKFFGARGTISASHVDAGYIFCGKGEAAINLGAPGEAARAIKEHPAPPGCSYSTRRYQYVSSVGYIPFKNVANGGTMSVAESLAMHAKEGQRAIAECNANPTCQAEVRRMSSLPGTGTNTYPCPSGGYYSNYNGAGRCTDSNGNPNPNGSLVYPQ